MDEEGRIINCCTCRPFWKRSPSLVFDYSEIDDAEFESQFTMATPLLRHTPTLPQPTTHLTTTPSSSSALVSPGIWTGFASLFRGSTARGLHPNHHHHHHTQQHQHQHIQSSSGRAGRQIPPPASLSLSLEDGGGGGYLGVGASDARLLSREEVDSLTSSYLQQDQMEISSKGGLRDVGVEEMLDSLEAASLSATGSRVSPPNTSAEAEVADELEKRRSKRDGGQVDHHEEEKEDLDQDLLGLLTKAASKSS